MIGVDDRDLVRAVKALRELKDKELNKALRVATNAAVEPAKDAYRAAALAKLPARGGLNRLVAGAKFRLQRLAGKTPGFVLIIRRAKDGGLIDLRKMNSQGIVRHPLPNTRGVWVAQKIPAHWFDEAIEPLKPLIAKKLRDAVQATLSDIASKTRT